MALTAVNWLLKFGAVKMESLVCPPKYGGQKVTPECIYHSSLAAVFDFAKVAPAIAQYACVIFLGWPVQFLGLWSKVEIR